MSLQKKKDTDENIVELAYVGQLTGFQLLLFQCKFEQEFKFGSVATINTDICIPEALILSPFEISYYNESVSMYSSEGQGQFTLLHTDKLNSFGSWKVFWLRIWNIISPYNQISINLTGLSHIIILQKHSYLDFQRKSPGVNLNLIECFIEESFFLILFLCTSYYNSVQLFCQGFWLRYFFQHHQGMALIVEGQSTPLLTMQLQRFIYREALASIKPANCLKLFQWAYKHSACIIENGIIFYITLCSTTIILNQKSSAYLPRDQFAGKYQRTLHGSSLILLNSQH